ncbi:hypothetical protein D0869_05158 [Hortaea werneckii]|uniref:HMG box domain-containing protein n=1 Tax=Hortaea werneckii TaxID=91943 RepID=A0A3M6WYH8_HORWE|nr:hypothetical protein D0869_05158 [Hortaea werneckii]
MSTTQDYQHHSSLPTPWIPAVPVQTQPATNEQPGRIIFTRQLWQRTMPDHSEQNVLNKSQSQIQDDHHRNHPRDRAAGPSRRTSSTVPTRSRRRSQSLSGGSKTPLTPEESPPSKSTRKRNAGTVEEEDKELDSASTTPVHTRASSGDSTAHVCICQPDPKIPRPRNAFILYRQHHQAQVVAQNPGLANPEISKIIGEQWQNQPPEIKNKWKALAEEEKLRHQQQYPTYRYQPKRNGRRNSLSSETPGSASERPKCVKCGGRSILAPSTPFTNASTSGVSPASVPPTPGQAITPVSRTLPVLRDLSLQSPANRRMGRVFPSNSTITSIMSSNGNSPADHPAAPYPDERDDIGPPSPETKRRRFNGEHVSIGRNIPPRFASTPLVQPGTPYPFSYHQQHQQQQQQTHPPLPSLPPQPHHSHHTHPYQLQPQPSSLTTRRESLPSLHGIGVSPSTGGVGGGSGGWGPMGPPPPPRPPGMGYQQHRLSQGHLPHDHRSLTLPPLQTSGNVGARNSIAGLSSASSVVVGAGNSLGTNPAAAVRRSVGGNRDPSSSSLSAGSPSANMTEDVIRGMDFRYKIGILAKVAPPAAFLAPYSLLAPSASAKDKEGSKKEGLAARGPLIAIEGDDAEAVRELGRWLSRELGKKGGRGPAEEDLEVRLVEGPLDEGSREGDDEGGKVGGMKRKKAIIEYHLLITEWLAKSDEIVESLRYRRAMPSNTAVAALTGAGEERDEDADKTMSEDLPTVQEKAKSERRLEEDYDDSDGSASKDEDITSSSAQDPINQPQNPGGEETTSSTFPPPHKPSHDEEGEGESMQIDPPLPPPPTSSSSSSPATNNNHTNKPVILLPNFSLHTSTAFALRIPIDPNSQYSAPDHWQWAATQWREVVGPDLTIYVRDSSSGSSASGIGGETGGTAGSGGRGRVVGGNGGVEMGEEGNLFVVRRTVGGGGGKRSGEVEGSVLRRLGFEVGEWVRAFGGSGEEEEGK